MLEQQAMMALPAGYEDPDSEQEQSYAPRLGATEQRPEFRPVCFSYASSSPASTRSSTVSTRSSTGYRN